MAKRKSAHLLRILIEGISGYSPYGGGRLSYSFKGQYDPDPTIAVDLITKIDIHRAIKELYERGELSLQEIKMLNYVTLDGRLSRREISLMIREEEGINIDQRTISRKLNSAYLKIAKFLGWEYQDNRVLMMVAKKMDKPKPYILNDDESESVTQRWERI